MVHLARTLVVYLHCYSPSRDASRRVSDNIDFFLRHGVAADQAVTFSLLFSCEAKSLRVPALPNVLLHGMPGVRGYEFEHYQAFFNRPELYPGRRADGAPTPVVPRVAAFEYFVLLSDSQRGPFVPTWLRAAPGAPWGQRSFLGAGGFGMVLLTQMTATKKYYATR